jgi:hypothetical protein
MRWLLKRWYVWLGLVLLLGLTGSMELIYSSQSRITQANFDRIQEGMSHAEVIAILGESGFGMGLSVDLSVIEVDWHEGANWISVAFTMTDADLFVGGQQEGRIVRDKTLHLATAWETLQWYAKNGAAKIDVNWD